MTICSTNIYSVPTKTTIPREALAEMRRGAGFLYASIGYSLLLPKKEKKDKTE